MTNDIYEFDKVTSHYFCKSCGNNYLLKTHKKSCEFYHEKTAQNIRTEHGIKPLTGKRLTDL